MNIILEGLVGGPLVTEGLGVFEDAVVDVVQPMVSEFIRRRGGGSGRRESYEVIIGTRILLVNGVEPPNAVKGYVKVTFDPDERPRVKLVESSAKKAEDRLVIRVKKVFCRG